MPARFSTDAAYYLSTNDNLTHNVSATAVPENCLMHLEAHILAKGPAGSMAVWFMTYDVTREAAPAAPVQLGPANNVVGKQALGPVSGWHADLVISGNEIVAAVDGDAGVPVLWTVFVHNYIRDLP